MPYQFTCETCGKQFERSQRHRMGVPIRFCSQSCFYLHRDGDPLTRFMSKVQIRDGENPCWIWIGAKYSSGYGLIRVNGQRIGAHRASWQFFRGEIPDGMFVCHNCPGGDCKSCVNPAHLFLGSPSDNIIDAMHKDMRRSKLSIDQIPEIRRLLSEGCTTGQIGQKYGVSYKAILKIKKGETWAHA